MSIYCRAALIVPARCLLGALWEQVQGVPLPTPLRRTAPVRQKIRKPVFRTSPAPLQGGILENWRSGSLVFW